MTKITGSKPLEINSLDWHALAHRFYVLLAGVVVTLLPQLIDPKVNYTVHFNSASYNASPFVLAAVTMLISIVKRYVEDNSNVTVNIHEQQS
jgi:hypothetical protein